MKQLLSGIRVATNFQHLLGAHSQNSIVTFFLEEC